ncbi:MAG: hypothetical protein LBD13_00200 [Spirochaetaceae bacterium]|jgi:hypothetical protein|nr:hypothetical protein [Spirochaetaceae bacterium]
MRIAIVSAPAERKPIPDYVKALQNGMASQRHSVDIIDAWTEDGFCLPSYGYIAVAAETVSLFGGRMPEVLPKVLGGRSGLGGKKSAAFLKKTGPFTAKGLARLMDAMEKEGMLVNWSGIILNASHAEALGRHIGS